MTATYSVRLGQIIMEDNIGTSITIKILDEYKSSNMYLTKENSYENEINTYVIYRDKNKNFVYKKL